MEKENQDLFIISHIVAASENNIIGKGDDLPWSLPDDFKYFKNKTYGSPIIMGRKTFQSLKKPLPGRTNIIITRDENFKQEGTTIVHDIQNAIAKARDTDCKEIFIIGGGEVFNQSADMVNRIYMTRVHANVEGNASYPAIDPDQWLLVSSLDHPQDEKHKYPFTFEVWEKTNNSSSGL